MSKISYKQSHYKSLSVFINIFIFESIKIRDFRDQSIADACSSTSFTNVRLPILLPVACLDFAIWIVE
jgi:hypothetical protein